MASFAMNFSLAARNKCRVLEAPGAAVSLGRSSLPRQPGAAVSDRNHGGLIEEGRLIKE